MFRLWFYYYICNGFVRVYSIICKWSVLYLFSFFFSSMVQHSILRLFTFSVLFAFLADRFTRLDQSNRIEKDRQKRKKENKFCDETNFLNFLCDIYIFGYFVSFHAAPPEITVERSWVHASDSHDVELACIVHGDVTSDVSPLLSFSFFFLSTKAE